MLAIVRWRLTSSGVGGTLRTAALVLLVAAFSAVATGCGSEDEEGGGDASAAEATNYPEESITVVIPSDPGGSADTIFRQLKPFWEKELGQTLVPDYKPGGGTSIGLNAALNAPGDGYTIGQVSAPYLQFLISGGILEKELADFAFIGEQAYRPAMLLVRKDSEWQTLDDLIQAAKEQPGKINVGLGVLNSDNGFSTVLVEETAGVDFNIVPFDSGSAADTALLGGDVDVVSTNVFSAGEIADETRVIAVHAAENQWGDITNDAATFGSSLPALEVQEVGDSTGYFTSASFASEYPERLEVLRSSFERAVSSPEFEESLGAESATLTQTVGDEFKADMEEAAAALEKYASLFEDSVGN